MTKYTHKKVDYSKRDLSNNNFVKLKRKVKIIDMRTKKIITADSCKEASAITGMSRASISRICNGKQASVVSPYIVEYQ